MELSADTSKSSWSRILAILGRNPRLSVLLLLTVVSTVLSKGIFLSPANLHNMLRQYAGIGIMAVGQTLVILLAGVDLSQGSVVALVSMVVAYLNTSGYGIIWPLVIGVSAGAACGLTSGLIVTKGKVPPFIATLAMSSIARGIATLTTQARPIYGLSKELLVFGRGTVAGIGIQILVWANTALLGVFLLARTVYGREVYIVGGNEKSANLSGISTHRVKLIAYILSGVCAALAGIMITSKMDMGGPYISLNDNVQSVASVVIGGTSFAGGRGSVSGAIVGALIIAMINNLMNLLLINPYIQQGIIGAIILLTVTMNQRKMGVR
ncbi:MAG: ABC transporter permease [Clostridia bacterium]|nr:ABC transporter permease [Clostridia bacterium]